MVPQWSIDHFLLRRSLKVDLGADVGRPAREWIDALGSDSSSRGAGSWRRQRDRGLPPLYLLNSPFS